MKKIITYYSFLITSLLTLIGFFSANNLSEIFSSLVFLPLNFFLWLIIFPERKSSIQLELSPAKVKKSINHVAEEPQYITNENSNNEFDPQRRRFLKLIGSAGLSLFLMALFTKKAEAAFFGSVPGPGTVGLKNKAGEKIDPAEKLPTHGYNISQIDDNSSPAFYGFVNKDGEWFIMKEENGEYLYTKGSSDFSNNWANRTSLTYDTFDKVF